MQRILFVSSSGGHLAQLVALSAWYGAHERRWVTFETADATSTLAAETTTWAYHPTTRNIPNLLRNFGLAFKVLLGWKPDVIISNGAAVALPFFIVGRLRGVRTIYLEVYDRVDSRTLTGRLVRPFTNLFLVQWPEQLELYPGSKLVGPLL